MTQTRSRTQCRKCGSTSVRWHEAKSGKWVLMDTTGTQYTSGEWMRGPHYQSCPGGTHAADMAKVQALIESYRCTECDYIKGSHGACEVCGHEEG
jgi:hypothetical protein